MKSVAYTGNERRGAHAKPPQGGVALSTDDDIAGRSVMFIIVDDLAAERRRLQGLGSVLGDDMAGDYSTLAQIRDSDGNLLTLATPPSRPYPPA
jgi:predicted enzyme related to lactoylglutathione lyase